MASRQNKQAESLAALSAEDRARLERLAALAHSTLEDVWVAVQRYGFDDMEESAQAWVEAEEDIAAGRTVSHEEVMAQAMQIVSQNGQRKRKAG